MISTNVTIGLIMLVAIISIYTILIMVIWNNVLLKKVLGANLQKINFWDAFAIAVFCSLITGGTTVINQCKKV